MQRRFQIWSASGVRDLQFSNFHQQSAQWIEGRLCRLVRLDHPPRLHRRFAQFAI